MGKLFGTDGVRGVANEELTCELAFKIGRCAAFVLTASVIYHKKKTRKNAIISCIIGTLVFTVISLPLNYFIVYPIYFNAFGGEAAILGMYQQIMGSVKNIFSALCIFNLPFTFVKGIICALVTILIYKPLSPILKGKD